MPLSALPSNLLALLRSILTRIKDNERLQSIISYLPPLNFITLHYAYFISTCMLASLVFWGSSNPRYSIGYTDSLFLVVSAMTEAGLFALISSNRFLIEDLVFYLTRECGRGDENGQS